MVDGGERAQRLIHDLMRLARIDSQAQDWQAVSLQTVLDETLRSLQLRLQEAGVTLTQDPLPTVVADARQMGQLLSNLLSNAIKFRGPQTPRIHIGAERQDGAWCIHVRDNGIGIEARFFERIFVMFQRLHLRSENDGTGIGLAICKRVVERHGGHIGVDSQPGQGSNFFFTLPDRAAVGVREPALAFAAL
jgi:light-regulated signal transduction histidine kinase (bacteriophytochrome)